MKRAVVTTTAIKFYIRSWIRDHAEQVDLKTLMYAIRMAEKSCDVLYIADIILSEKHVRKLPLNNVIKHIKTNLKNRYLLQYFFLVL